MAAVDDLVGTLIAEREQAIDEHDDLLAALRDAEFGGGSTLAQRVRFERVGAVEPTPRTVLDPGKARVRVRKR